MLALDYGKRHIGLALSEELGVTIQPLPSIPNRGRRALIAHLQEVIRERHIEHVVIGMPVNMDGTSGEAARDAEGLREELGARLGLPVAAVDERLTTVEALEAWRSLSPRRRKRYRTVDSLAAALILRRYLDDP